MAKDPAFLFYPGDWLGGTQLFSRYHKGAYMDLLMAQFANGHLSLDDIRMKLGEDDFAKMWDSKLKAKFKIDENGLFFNEKLEIEMIKRKNYVGSRTDNLKKEGKKSTHKDTHKKNHMLSHMDYGNENVDVIKKVNANPIGIEVMSHFNLVCKKRLSLTSDSCHKFINARLNEGYTKQDLFEIIEIMYVKWSNDDKMKQYLHPHTLFNKEKAEKYMGFVKDVKENGTTVAELQGKKVKKDAATLSREAMEIYKSKSA